MKVIYYQEQKKITVKNVSISDVDQLQSILHEQEPDTEMDLKDLQLYNFKITSTRAFLSDEPNIQDETLEKEIEEGINWHQETVN